MSLALFCQRRPSPAFVVAMTVTVVSSWLLLSAPRAQQVAAADPPKKLDPAAWGMDHVGQELPEYMESGECLFCHREQVGKTWPRNKHNRTIREAEATEPAMQALAANEATKGVAAECTLLMGDTRAAKFLRRSKDYGKLEVLSTDATISRTKRAKLEHTENPHWDTEVFAKECAGCHTTAVDPETHAFAAVALDCFTCHGDAPAEHANDGRLMPLAKKRKDSAAVVISICASCHVRFGKSKASGLPYPTNFVAGDNLFRDFQVDFALADDEKINPGDRHVLDNIRDVVVNGNEKMTCLNCHDVHNNNSKKHRDVPDQKYCLHCHEAGKPKTEFIKYDVHSERCRY
jgi:hypothetical protein